jgi:thiamine-phosphate pyrophosphorylase
MSGAGARRALDLSVYLVTDPAMTARRGLAETVRAAVAGGATAVQLRDKDARPEELLAAARGLLALLRPLGVPLVVNDDVEVAAAAGADGVHVGQSDLAATQARARLGPGAIVGLSVTGAADVPGVEPAVVDYVGLGPIFATGTKADASAALGEEEFAAVRRRLALPVVAIGGLTAENAGRAIRAGADGVAVVSAICAAEDPEEAARRIARAVAAARAGGGGAPR